MPAMMEQCWERAGKRWKHENANDHCVGALIAAHADARSNEMTW